MKMKLNKLDIYRIITLVLVIITCIFVCCFYKIYNSPAPEPIIIRDTITVTNFETKIKEIPITYYDTIISDTIKFNDTIYKEVKDTIRIPIETKESSFEVKKDSFEINGIITHSGFNSTIEKVDFDYKFTYQPPIEKKRKFHISAQVGFGVQYGLIHKQFDVGPYAGIGFSYDIW